MQNKECVCGGGGFRIDFSGGFHLMTTMIFLRLSVWTTTFQTFFNVYFYWEESSFNKTMLDRQGTVTPTMSDWTLRGGFLRIHHVFDTASLKCLSEISLARFIFGLFSCGCHQSFWITYGCLLQLLIHVVPWLYCTTESNKHFKLKKTKFKRSRPYNLH